MIISSPTVQGSGQITGAFANAEGSILAITSRFPLLTNPPARASYTGHDLQHRVALHRRGEAAPFAWFDKLQVPINWISFHPVEPVIAIGAGAYDGGWCFDGALFLWNWQDGSWHQLFSSVPEVRWVGFEPDGAALKIITRPWDEEWDSDQPDDAFTRFYATSLAYHPAMAEQPLDLAPTDRLVGADLAGFLSCEQAQPKAEEQIAAWLNLPALNIRGAIWDLAWTGPDRIASVSNECLLRIHDLNGVERTRITGEGYGAAILASQPPTLHVAHVWPWPWTEGEPTAQLHIIQGETLVELGSYPGSYSFTASLNGTVLGRLDRNRPDTGQKDIVIDVATGIGTPINLGHYDCFNHFVGIDGAPDHYFLQANPPKGYQRKGLFRLDADMNSHRLWPVLPDDGTNASHAMECCGCYLEDAAGPGIVLAGVHFGNELSAENCGFIYRKPLNSDHELWRQPITAGVAALLHLPETGCIAVAFLDGNLKLIDAQSGMTRTEGKAMINGQPTVVFSLAAHQGNLALGTMDGRIAVIAPEALLADAPHPHGIELA